MMSPGSKRRISLLFRQHGKNAELEAARLQDLLLDLGDEAGRYLWRRIMRAIEGPQAPPGKPY